MKRTLIGAAIAVAAIAGTALAQGYGMGPGMMGDHMGGMGPGMMGGGMGPGMMGGGMGPGMMGGYGAGYAALDLSDEQRKQIDAIEEDTSRKQGELMGVMHKQMFELRLEARKRIDAVLTPEQRKQLGR